MFQFKILTKDQKTKARSGILKTSRGNIQTPCFVPVATKGAIKGPSFEKIHSFGSDIFMINTFHFFCNNRFDQVTKFKGLHNFIGENYPLMTDSGGFQVFSLGSGWEYGVGKLALVNKNNNIIKKNKVIIDNDGVSFVSPYNGNKLRMTPEISIKVQEKLGADIIFSFDECTSPLDSYEYTKNSLTRTHNWAKRCIKSFKGNNQVMMGVVQGGPYNDLRKESAQFIGSLPFFGFGIGGSFGGSFGDSKTNMHKIINEVISILPDKKPRHLLGIGEPDDILESVERGIDFFDCVVPTRWARHGTAITYKGRINLRNAKFLNEKKPIDNDCICPICQKYSSAYIHHLLREKEIYGAVLLSEHNLFWILNFMKEIRKAIEENRFSDFKKKTLKKYCNSCLNK